MDEPRRFSDLVALIPGITERTLGRQLRELAAHGLVARQTEHEAPFRERYVASELGRALRPLVGALCEWGRLHQRAMPCRETTGA